MPPTANPEMAAPRGRAAPDNPGPNNAAAARGSFLNNEILTMISVGIALAVLLVMLFVFTNNRIDRLEIRLDTRIDRLDDKIDKLDNKIDDKFDKLDTRIDKLDDKIDALLLELTRNNAISAEGAERAAKPQ